MSIKICDSIMGSGKTCAAIRYMNENDGNFVYLTPYLDEVDRIKKNCSKKNFVSPENRGHGKLSDLHNQLGQKTNIASTHALFSYYNEDTATLISEGEYTLILDEVFNVLEPMNINESDINALLKSGLACIEEDGRHIKWLEESYDGTKFADVKSKATANNLVCYKGMMTFWSFPVEIFKAFKEVIVLTYMFEAQIQSYYYEMNNIDFEKIGIDRDDRGYKFGDRAYYPDSVFTLKDKIHILDKKKINFIGESKFALSSSWYSRNQIFKEKPLFVQLKKNVYNYYRNIVPGGSSERMWTTFKEYVQYLKDDGYASGFVSCNARATNEYRNRNVLAYLINIYYNPVLKNYFSDHGVKVREDEYALSEMIQWIWRSAIRDGKEIWIYIPSSRMRKLLEDWLEKLYQIKSGERNSL